MLAKRKFFSIKTLFFLRFIFSRLFLGANRLRKEATLFCPRNLVPLLMFLAVSLPALDVPPLEARVNDLANILSPTAAKQIEDYLLAVEQYSGVQIALLTIASLEDEALESYSLKVAESWGLGGAQEDNGLLFLVAMADKKIRIEVGYGLEASLTDALTGYIIRETVLPEFRAGNFEAGIMAGVQNIGGVVTEDIEISSQQIQASEERQQEKRTGAPRLLFLFLFLFLLGRVGRYRRLRRRGISPGAAFFMGSMLGHSTRGGGGGGFGSGGFSGGGGGFGGGGASGGW